MAELTSMRIRVLRALEHRTDWTTRGYIGAQTGDSKGFSEAIGSPITGIRPDSLEGMRFVVRLDDKKPFKYKITEAGRRALRSYDSRL